ncbi:MAG: class I SAM-dependent methyltransferase [Cyanobacteria bacterium P01_H01_bin.58]
MPDASPPRPDIAYIPTPEDVVDALLDLAQVGPEDILYDLGCGDGRLLIRAAQRWGTRGVGIDIDPVRIAQAQAMVKAHGLSEQIELRQENLYNTDLQPATVVVIYLLPHLNLRLRSRLWQQLKPGSRVVSHQFDMGDWEPSQIIHLPKSKEESTLYLWVMT